MGCRIVCTADERLNRNTFGIQLVELNEFPRKDKPTLEANACHAKNIRQLIAFGQRTPIGL